MRIGRLRSGFAVLLLTVSLTLLVLHCCQEPPGAPDPTDLTSTTQYPLAVTGTGTGDGVVTSFPAAINCVITKGLAASTGCSANFAKNTVVTLTPKPQSGHSFVSWSKSCTGTTMCTLTMGASKSVTARFLKGPFTIRITGGSTGVGDGVVQTQAGLTPAINCVITKGVAASTGCAGTYPAYTEIQLVTTPAAGQGLITWGTPCSGSGACQLVAVQARTISATIGSVQPLSVAGTGTGGGTVKSQAGLTPAIYCVISGGTAATDGCARSYATSTLVTLTANPDAGNAFTGWSGGCTGTGTCQVTMAQATAVTAAFLASGTSNAAAQGRWGAEFSVPVIAVHMHLLPTGQVFLWGANGEGQLWDPQTSAYTEVPDPYQIFCSGHTFLADGRLLVAGGHISSDHGLPRASIFDPASGSWSPTGLMARGRWYPTTTALPNGEVLVLAGRDETSTVVLTPEVWNGSTWRQLTTAATVDLPYYPRAFVAPNGRVFMAGEKQMTRYLDVTGTGQWTSVGNRKTGGRSYGSAVMYAPGKIVYMGGGDPPMASAEVIDLNQAAPAWRLVPGMAYARRQMNATLLADGQVLVTDGTSGAGFNDQSSAVRYAELWNPSTETWSTMAIETAPRVYHSTALLLPDGGCWRAGAATAPTRSTSIPPRSSRRRTCSIPTARPPRGRSSPRRPRRSATARPSASSRRTRARWYAAR